MSTERFAPRHLQREIQNISPRYFLDWNNIKERWEVRAWTHFYWKPSVYKIEQGIRKDTPCYLIRRCYKNDEMGRDVGYRPLDHGFIVDNMVGFYNTQQVKKLLHQIDSNNKMIQDAVDSQEDYEHRAAAKAIYKHYREPSVFINRN